jgi:hypothetical protein
MAMLPGPYYQGYKGRIWRTVVAFLILLVCAGLAMIGYPPARLAFSAMDRFRPALYWLLVIVFLFAVFWPRPR